MEPRGSQLRLAYHPAFARQTDLSTQIPNNQLTAVFQATSRNHIGVQENADPILDCSQQFKIGEEVISRIGRLTIEADADANVLGGLMALVLGVSAAPTGTGPFTHNLSMMDTATFQGPAGTFIVGFEGVANSGLLFKGAVLDTLKVLVSGNKRAKVTADFIGFGDRPPQAGFVFPVCTDIVPIKLRDGLFTIGGASKLNLLKELEFTFSNGILANEDPFTLASIDPQRLERADLRTMSLRFKLEGYEGDANHQLLNTTPAVQVRFGTATNGVLIDIPVGKIKEDQSVQGFEGEASRAVLNMLVDPWKVSGNAATPLTVQAINGNDTQYLLAA